MNNKTPTNTNDQPSILWHDYETSLIIKGNLN